MLVLRESYKLYFAERRVKRTQKEEKREVHKVALGRHFWCLLRIQITTKIRAMVEGAQPLRWILVAIVIIHVSLGARVKRNCQCVPDQWQGILASVDREFDLTGGRTGSSENYLYITYDYVNKKFSMTDLNTGNRAIADYTKVRSV